MMIPPEEYNRFADLVKQLVILDALARALQIDQQGAVFSIGTGLITNGFVANARSGFARIGERGKDDDPDRCRVPKVPQSSGGTTEEHRREETTHWTIGLTPEQVEKALEPLWAYYHQIRRSKKDRATPSIY